MKRSPVRISFAFALGLSLALVLLWLLGGGLPTALSDSPHYVAPDGSCGTGYTPCHATVQGAVDGANDGDVIKVAAGTYTGVLGRALPLGYLNPPASGLVTQVVYISKTVTIQGGYTPGNWTTPDPINNPTLIDAQGQGRALVIAGNITPTLTGLRLTNGNATGLGGGPLPSPDGGGGVYIITASATISNCQVFSNTADRGGGFYLDSSPATLNGNAVLSNTINRSGGGLYLYRSAAILNGNTVRANTAAFYGGGLYVYQSAATFDGNSIISNTANDLGGGVYLFESSSTLMNTIVADNRADSNGSGVAVEAASPRLLHTTIARNTGGDGSGVNVWSASAVVITNTILVSQTVGVRVEAGSAVTLESTLWNGNTTNTSGNVVTGTHNYTGDPNFVNANAGNYHIAAGSAAINRGVDAGVATDLDGIARPQGSQPDLGAYEAAADLTISKGVMPASGNPGDSITFTLAFANIGAYTATGVLITDTVPISVTSVNVFSSGVVITQSSPGYVWVVQDLAAGQKGIITITAALSRPLAAGIFTNTATIGLAGADSDPGNNRSEASVTVNNVAPVAVDDVYSTNEDSPLTVDASGVLSNDLRYNGSLSAVLVSNVLTGTLTLNADGSFVYAPSLDYNGPVTFTYRVTDTFNLSNLAMVTITVNPMNDPPSFTSTPVTVAVVNVVYTTAITTTDPDVGDLLTITSPISPTWLTLVRTGNGTAILSGTPGSGAVGDNPVTLQVRDTAGLTATQSFTIVVASSVHTLTVNKTGAGTGTVTSNPPGINCGGVCSADFEHNSAVTLTATAAANSDFTSWSGGICSGAGTCTVTMDAAKSVTATFALKPNSPPVAEAGSNQTVGVSATVTLNGSASVDPDNRLPLSYAWTQTGGPNVTYNQALSVTTFTAPGTSTVLTFTLTVTDAWGLASTTPDTVAIAVRYMVYLPVVIRTP